MFEYMYVTEVSHSGYALYTCNMQSYITLVLMLICIHVSTVWSNYMQAVETNFSKVKSIYFDKAATVNLI